MSEKASGDKSGDKSLGSTPVRTETGGAGIGRAIRNLGGSSGRTRQTSGEGIAGRSGGKSRETPAAETGQKAEGRASRNAGRKEARDSTGGARDRQTESAKEPKPGKLEKAVRKEGERTQLRQETQDPASDRKLKDSINQLMEKSKDAVATLNMEKVGHLKHAPPEVNQAIDRCKESVREMAHLDKGSEKTPATSHRKDGTRLNTVSGGRGSPNKRWEQGDVNKTRDHCGKIGHKLAGSGRDKNFSGETAAGHAEKHEAIKNPNKPVGVSRPMCKDCKSFMQKEAAYQGKDQYVADPRMARVFKPDQRIMEYHYNDRVVEVAPDGKRTEIRPPSGRGRNH